MKSINGSFAFGWVLGIILAVVAVFPNLILAKTIFEWRTVLYAGFPLTSDAGMEKAHNLLNHMDELDYNCMFVDAYWVPKIHTSNISKHKPKLDKFIAEAKKKQITVLPMSQTPRGSMLLEDKYHEALPNTGTPFVVSGGKARAKGDPSVAFVNGNFEQPLKGTWSISGPFSITSGQRPGGTGSKILKCTNPTTASRNVSQSVKVKPFRTYELSMWVKATVVKMTKGHDASRGIYFIVTSGNQPTLLKDRELLKRIRVNNTWQLFKQKFNSLNNTTVKINAHATNYATFEGTVWYDDVSIREVGLYETSDNPGFPVVVKKGSTVLKAGADYVVGKEILTIPAGSAAKEGDELTVDWGTIANVVLSRTEAAFCHQATWDAMRAEVALEDKWFDTPPARLMKYSEWRLGGWDPAAVKEYDIIKNGSGPYFAGTANQTANIYREANSNRECLIFSDNYNPYHSSSARNAVINGGNLGSGHGLDSRMIVVNWYAGGNSLDALKYFAGMDKKVHGAFGQKKSTHRQIFSCNYGAWQTWLKHLKTAEAAGLPKGAVIGIGYQTYKGYDKYLKNMGPLKNACAAEGRWGKGPINFPAAGIASEKPVSAKNSQVLLATITQKGTIRNLSFSVPTSGNVRLDIVNLNGQKVSSIMNEEMAEGTYQRNVDVSRMASGIYFARLTMGSETIHSVTRKMVVF